MAKIIQLQNLFIPDEKIWIDIFLGILFGILFIGLNVVTGGNVTIGIPSWFTTVGERWAIVVGLAPFFEELLFRGVLFWALLTIFPLITSTLTRRRIQGEGLGLFVSFLVIPVAFSIFHATAYASSLSAQNISATLGLFIGAWLFGLITLMLVLFRKNFWAGVVMHMIVNAYIMSQLFVIVA